MDIKNYDQFYSNAEYHFGIEPNKLVIKLLDFLPSDSFKDKVVLDLGCGEGKNSVFSLKRVLR